MNIIRRPAPVSVRLDPWLIPAALLGLIPLLSLLRPGIASTADGIVHLLRALQATELFKAGVFYPQWAPDFYFGYGYPFFLFYTPGVHILVSLIGLTGLGVTGGLVATQALAVLLYGSGAYLAAKSMFAELARPRVVSMAALAAAALYVFAPLRMRELFNQGNLSQLVALSLFPWSLWALLKAARRPSWRWAAIAGLLMAALLYAHHPSAFLAYPLLFALALAAVWLQAPQRRQASLRVAAAFALALLLSAPFWLPWLLESSYGSLESMETGPFNAALNLVPADQLFSPSLLLDATSINTPRPLTLGRLQAVLAAAGALVVLLLRLRRRDAQEKAAAALLLFTAGLLLLCILLMLPIAAPLWTNLPLAQLIAFPWRLLGPAGLLAALLGGALLLPLSERWALPALVVALLAAPLSVAPYLFPPAALWQPTPAGGLTLADIGRYEATGGSRGTASANEYLPRWVEDPDPPQDLLPAYAAGELPERLDVASLPPGARFETVKSASLETVHRIALPEAGAVIIRRFYYPGWRAWIDGAPAELHPVAPYGLIQVAMPAGEHELRVAWGSTRPRQAGWLLFGVGALAALLLLAQREPRAGAAPANPAAPAEYAATSARGAGRLWLVATGVILLLAGVKALWIEPRTDWFRLASPVDAPAGMTHNLNIRYDNGMELLGYDLPATETRQGGEIRVRLFWRAHQQITEDLRSFVHLDAPVTGETWANQTQEHIGGMPTSKWPTGFYVVDDFRVAVPLDAAPIFADLRVGLLTRSGELIPLPDGSEKLSLGEVAIRAAWRPGARQSGGRSAYRLGDNIALEDYTATVVVEADASRHVALTLRWRATERPGQDYTVFAQVIDSTGQRVGQLDGPACAGACPTTRWTPGGLIEDRREIPLLVGASTTGLRVLAGMYDPESGERLPAVAANGAEAPERAISIDVASPTETDTMP